MSQRIFRDRREAGRLLAKELAAFASRPDVIVLALPRGGVPVGYEVARVLGAPLDVFLVRKLGVPGYEELAMGAVASGGLRVLNENIVKTLRIPDHVIETVVAQEEKELTSYGWVDPKAGIVHIPIDEAIKIVASRGLPQASPSPCR